jgi:hypothetical protein
VSEQVNCLGSIGERNDKALAPHPTYAALGASRVERSTAYRSLIAGTKSDESAEEVRIHLPRQRALHGSPFQRRVEQRLRLVGRASAA